MSNYSAVYKSLWASKKFNMLDASEKLIFLYLLTNEKVKQTGIYNILLKQIACDCDIDIKNVASAVEKMAQIELIKYWKDENLIYIHKFFKYSKGCIKSPKILLGVIDRQKELLSNHEIWKMFDAEFKDDIALINERLIDNQSNKGKGKNKYKNNPKNSNSD